MDAHADFKKMEDYWLFPIKDACLSVSIEIGLFERVRDEHHTAESLALRLNLNSQVLRALTDALTALGFLNTDEKALSLAPIAGQFLNSLSLFDRSEGFLGSDATGAHHRLKFALLNGWDPLDHDGQSYTQMWSAGEISPEAAERFTFGMQRSIQYPASHNAKAKEFSGIERLVDLGGGSGAWAKALIDHHPNIKVSIFDLPPVLETAKLILSELGVPLHKIEFCAGNFFKDDLPKCQAYLLSNILHDWSFDQSEQLLKKVADSSAPGTQLFIHECILDESRTAPEFTCVFNLMMAINHRSQQFTFAELNALLIRAGFRNLRLISEVAHYQLLCCEKA